MKRLSLYQVSVLLLTTVVAMAQEPDSLQPAQYPEESVQAPDTPAAAINEPDSTKSEPTIQQPAAIPVTAPEPKSEQSVAPSAEAGNGFCKKRFFLGLRLPPFQFGIPMGDISKDLPLGDVVTLQLPVWLDIGYMILPKIMVGLYAQYGFMMPIDYSNIRFGVQGQYHFSPAGKLDPWCGLGIGWEIMRNDELKLNGDEYSGHWNGMDFFNIQAGLDFKLLSIAGLGPYISWSMGQYFNYSSSDPFQGKKSGSIAEKAMHEWLTPGIRLALKL